MKAAEVYPGLFLPRKECRVLLPEPPAPDTPAAGGRQITGYESSKSGNRR